MILSSIFSNFGLLLLIQKKGEKMFVCSIKGVIQFLFINDFWMRSKICFILKTWLYN